MNAMIGKTIGKYRIVEHLGRGGMAEVYKAYQLNLDRFVAVKMMHSFLTDEKEFLTRFQREAKAVATLRHPNIVQVYDFDVEGGVYYMVMEYINGGALKARLQDLESKGEWISQDDAVRIILSVGSALKYAHERGMVHRDVKPANVMITLDGQVILTDFGIAKIVSVTSLTASGSLVGTPSYMAPEQGMGQPGDERSDIYSLGVMLYQLVLARLPYDADTPLAIILKHINEPLPLPKTIKPDLPEGLNRVILEALAKDPNERYQKVGEMTADLRRATGLAQEDAQFGVARASAIKLTGATMAGRIGGAVTPLPQTSPRPIAATPPKATPAATSTVPTQVSSPSTVVSAGRARIAPVKRRRWLAPMLGLVIVAILAVGAVAAVIILRGGGIAPPTPTMIAAAPAIPSTDTPTPALTTTPTLVPITTQLLALVEQTELRTRPGSEATSQVMGLLPAGAQFFAKVRSADSKWVRIEVPDGTLGWVTAATTGLTADQLSQLPVASTLIKLTDTPTPTLPPTDTPTATPSTTPTPTATSTATATKVGTPRPTATPKPRATASIPVPGSPGLITSFEPFGSWRIGNQPNGTFTQSSARTTTGCCSGQLHYEFTTPGNDYVVFSASRPIPIGGQPTRISAKVYGDGIKNYFNVWIIDAEGDAWQIPLGNVGGPQWKTMVGKLNAPHNWPFQKLGFNYDGRPPGDDAITYPIRFYAIALDDPDDAFVGSGDIFIDDLTALP